MLLGPHDHLQSSYGAHLLSPDRTLRLRTQHQIAGSSHLRRIKRSPGNVSFFIRRSGLISPSTIPLAHSVLHVRNGNANNRREWSDLQQTSRLPLNDPGSLNKGKAIKTVHKEGSRLHPGQIKRTEVGSISLLRQMENSRI